MVTLGGLEVWDDKKFVIISLITYLLLAMDSNRVSSVILFAIIVIIWTYVILLNKFKKVKLSKGYYIVWGMSLIFFIILLVLVGGG